MKKEEKYFNDFEASLVASLIGMVLKEGVYISENDMEDFEKKLYDTIVINVSTERWEINKTFKIKRSSFELVKLLEKLEKIEKKLYGHRVSVIMHGTKEKNIKKHIIEE